MYRKSTIRAFNFQLKAPELKAADSRPNLHYDPTNRRHSGRPRKYSQRVDTALQAIWEDRGYICAERLHSAISESVRIMKRGGQWRYGDSVGMLPGMSMGTMKNDPSRWLKKKAWCVVLVLLARIVRLCSQYPFTMVIMQTKALAMGR